MNTLVLVDFDGTLYKKDSLLEFTKFSVGKIGYCKGILLLSPYLIGFKLRLISNEQVKIKYLTHFFKGLKHERFKSLALDFALEKIQSNLNAKIWSEFLVHLASKHKIYIVTASVPEWIEPWSHQFGVVVIGTNMEVRDHKLTGKLTSSNCYGIEKVNRIKEILNLEEFETIKVYGSGKGDCEMLNLEKRKQ